MRISFRMFRFFLTFTIVFGLVLVPVKGVATEKEGWLELQMHIDAADDREALEKVFLDLLKIFQEAAPLNPPQGFEIQPRGVSRPPLDDVGLITGRLYMPIWFPGWEPLAQPSARISVWVNEPEGLLGTPVLADQKGRIYLLPPVISQKPGGDLFSRGSHPPGYKEAYPSHSMFPLWDWKVEPFLRAVVRPTFLLGQEEGIITVVTPDGNPFWKPVSQERWINALKAYAEAELSIITSGHLASEEALLTQQQIQEIRSYMAALQAAFDEEEIIRNHEQNLKEYNELYNFLKVMNPDQAEEFYITMIETAHEFLEEQLTMAAELRLEFQKLEQQVLEDLLARGELVQELELIIEEKDWDRLEELGQELRVEYLVFLAYAGRSLEGMEEELANMSSVERAAPAYGFELPPWHPFGPHRQVVAMPFEAERPSGLLAADAEGARALVSIDPEYFTPSSASHYLQLLVVDWWEKTHATFYSPEGRAYNEVRVNLMERLWDSLEWERLEDLLK